MMKIFASACDPVSWCKLLDIDSTTTIASLTTYFDNDTGLFNKNALCLGNVLRYIPDRYVKVPVTGDRCFMKWTYSYFAPDNGTKKWLYDPRKFIEFYNSDNELIASIGFNTANTNFDMTNTKSGLFSWTKAGAVKNSVIEGSIQWKIIGVPDGGYGNRSVETAFAVDYFVDPNNANNSYFAIYAGNREIARLTSSQLTDNPNNKVAKVIFMRNWSNSFSNYYGYSVNNLVVTDTPNFALKAVTVRPQALTYSVDFTGPITNISDTLQDANYISSSAETGKYIEFSLAKWNPNSNVTLGDFIQTKFLNLDIYFYGRYTQIGGISATFTITVFDDQGAKVLEKDIVVAANEDNIYYQTKFVDSVTLALLPFSQIVSGKVRITLKEI